MERWPCISNNMIECLPEAGCGRSIELLLVSFGLVIKACSVTCVHHIEFLHSVWMWQNCTMSHSSILSHPKKYREFTIRRWSFGPGISDTMWYARRGRVFSPIRAGIVCHRSEASEEESDYRRMSLHHSSDSEPCSPSRSQTLLPLTHSDNPEYIQLPSSFFCLQAFYSPRFSLNGFSADQSKYR